MTRPRGRPRKHPLPEQKSVTEEHAWAAIGAAPKAGFACADPDLEWPTQADYDAAVVKFVQQYAAPSPETPAEPFCLGRVRWKGSSGAHPRGALQVAWQCAGGIEWRPIEFAHADAPDTEDAP